MYFTYFLLLVSTCNLISYADTNSGHMKPFGSVGSLVNIEETNKEYPNLLKLFTNYLSKSETILSRQVLINDMYYSIWQTDEQLENEVDGLSKVNIFVESIKQRKRIQMNFGDFLDKYSTEGLFFADVVPEILRKYITVPRPLQCDEILRSLQSALLIINSINASPLMFNDENDLYFCLLRGNKRVVLVNTNKYPDAREIVIPDKKKARRPPLNPDSVDYNQYPELENIDYNVANLTSGDCLFIPNGWIFQERSFDNTVSVIYNLNHKQILNVDLEELKICSTNNNLESSLTLDQIDWAAIESEPQNIRDIIMSLIHSKTNTIEKWQETFSKYFAFDLASDPQTLATFDEFYGIIDIDGNGDVTSAEIEKINGAHQHHISDVLYELINLVNQKQKTASTKTENKTEDDDAQEILENTESSGDQNEDMDEDFNSQYYKTDL